MNPIILKCLIGIHFIVVFLFFYFFFALYSWTIYKKENHKRDFNGRLQFIISTSNCSTVCHSLATKAKKEKREKNNNIMTIGGSCIPFHLLFLIFFPNRSKKKKKAMTMPTEDVHRMLINHWQMYAIPLFYSIFHNLLFCDQKANRVKNRTHY